MAYLDEQTQRINDMYNQLKNSQITQLQQSRDSSVTDLNRQRNEQLPQYQTARTQADVGRVQEMQRLKEQMASNGAYNSGDNFTRQANVNTLRNNSYNQINGNENQFVTGISNKIADTNNQYNANVNSVSQSVEADRMKAVMNLQERLRQEQLAREAEERQRQAAASKTANKVSSSKANISKDPYGNDNQKNIYEFYGDNKVAYGDKMDALAQIINDQGYSQEDRDYADRMRQALRSQSYYDAAYANYRGGY